jgi:hypothetical protein
MTSVLRSTRHFAHRGTAHTAILCALWLLACASNPCGPGGEPWKNPYPVVAQTVDPDGTVVDWIPIESQLRPGETMPSPPPYSYPPTPVGGSPAPPAASAPFLYESSRNGPEGTVPYPHPKGLNCECREGYISRPNSPCVKLSENCSSEGFEASGKTFTACCPGLQSVTDLRLTDGQCVDFGVDYVICVRCGDGVCGKGVSVCNCPTDCPRK